MEINAATTIATQESGNSKAQTGLDVLTRTLAKSGQLEQNKAPQVEAMRVDIANQTGKGQNIDIKA